MFTKDIGIDLGTANTLVYMKGRGIIMREPSVVAVDPRSDELRVRSVGHEAKAVIGRAPGSIVAVRPLKDGVIADFDVTAAMLQSFIRQACGNSILARPRVVICVPSGVTEVERRAVKDATYEAGAKDVKLIDQPIAAAVGAGIPVSKARGAMLVDLGGGVSEASVISLGGIVQAGALRIAGDELDIAIVDYLKRTREILIGEITAERLKKRIGSALPTIDRGSLTVCGRDLRNGLATTAEITSSEVREAIREPLTEIVRMVKQTLEETPPELSADIFDHGIVMTGGMALLPGFDQLLRTGTGVRVAIAKQPGNCTCLGMGRMLKSANGDFSKFVK